MQEIARPRRVCDDEIERSTRPDGWRPLQSIALHDVTPPRIDIQSLGAGATDPREIVDQATIRGAGLYKSKPGWQVWFQYRHRTPRRAVKVILPAFEGATLAHKHIPLEKVAVTGEPASGACLRPSGCTYRPIKGSVDRAGSGLQCSLFVPLSRDVQRERLPARVLVFFCRLSF